MQPISDIRTIDECLQVAKRGAGQFITNFFPNRKELQLWINRGAVYGVVVRRTAFIFRRDADFFHLYFASSDPESLDSSLENLVSDGVAATVADLLGKPADVARLVLLFEKSGFQQRASLDRMVLTRDLQERDGQRMSGACFAEYGDAEPILVWLRNHFDKYAEQLPDREEIDAAVANRNILTIREGQKLAGFLHFEIDGLSATVRYWFVAPQYRSGGVGSALMRAFVTRCKAVKRILLWVITTNENAINKYEHYGFVRDNLVDHVMIKRGSSV